MKRRDIVKSLGFASGSVAVTGLVAGEESEDKRERHAAGTDDLSAADIFVPENFEENVTVLDGAYAEKLIERRDFTKFHPKLRAADAEELNERVERLHRSTPVSPVRPATDPGEEECAGIDFDPAGLPVVTGQICVGPDECEWDASIGALGTSISIGSSECGKVCKTNTLDAGIEFLELKTCFNTDTKELNMVMKYCNWRPWNGWKCRNSEEHDSPFA